MKLDDYIRQADDIINKKASQEIKEEEPSDEIVKLAEILERDEQKPDPIEETPFEKAAHAMAIVETIFSIEDMQKLASFVEQARE